MVVHVCGFMAHCPFMYACTDCRTVVSISCTVVHICMYNIAWRTRAHRPRTGRCAKFHFSLRNFLLPDCTTKVVTKYIFYENFSKFGRIKSKLMKKIWALRARNSDLGQAGTHKTPELKIRFAKCFVLSWDVDFRMCCWLPWRW